MLKTDKANEVELFLEQKEIVIANTAENVESTTKAPQQFITRVKPKKPSRDTLDRIIAKVKRI